LLILSTADSRRQTLIFKPGFVAVVRLVTFVFMKRFQSAVQLIRSSVQLMPEDLREIESAASNITVQGARYPEHLQKLVGR